MTCARRIWLGCCTVAVLLSACGSKPAVVEKRYPVQAVVKALDPAAHTATIQHGKIGDWMEAMTMEFPVKPETEFAKLHVDDRIEATVVVAGDNFWVTNVKVVAKP